MSRFATACCTFLLLFSFATGRAYADKIDDYILAQMQKRHIPGISIAIVRDGKPEKMKGYGLANVELSVPATEKTAYALASVTKQFTATAVMMLVEDGKIGLDDKLSKYYDGIPKTWETVTVRSLLNHTSGLKNYTALPDYIKDIRIDISQHELIKLVTEFPLDFPTGEQWAYSNTNYFLLGSLIEKVAGKPYNDFLTERIFKPLGMNATRLDDKRALLPNRAAGYSLEKGVLQNSEIVSPTQSFAAGGLISTVEDMAKWDAALYGEKLLKKSALEQMWTPTTLKDGTHRTYGFGWAIANKETGGSATRRIEHAGGMQGFSTHIVRYFDDKFTVIVLANLDTASSDKIAHGLVALAAPQLLPALPKPVDDPTPQISQALKSVILRAMKGEADAADFAPAFREVLIPRIKESKAIFVTRGALKTFTLIERKQAADRLTLIYRADFEESAARFTFTLDKDNKILGAMFVDEL